MESAKQKAHEEYSELKAEGNSSRDAMLKAIRQNQPLFTEAPVVAPFDVYFDDVLQKFIDVLTGIGGQAYLVSSNEDVIEHIEANFPGVERIVSYEAIFAAVAEIQDGSNAPHQFEDVDVCILTSPLAVAENSAVWISDKEMPERVLPFIAQSLVVVIHKNNIVPTMHQAYDIIADKDYDFATFIAGPSKTADIEQSLVLGAHGPKTMTVFIIND